jgi:hypothetical protein
MAHRDRPGTRWDQCVTRLPRVTPMRIAGKVTMVTVALVAAATLSACANSEKDSTATGNSNSSAPTLPVTTTPPKSTGATAAPGQPAAGECKADDIKVAGDFGAKPTITIPDTCKPPTTLLTKDLKVGTGPEVKNSSVVSANYLLETWSDKKEVDTSFGKQPLTVQGVGTGQVIQGWDQGLLGLKEGGRRLLIVPPALGYGPQGQGPIKANEVLVFVTDAVKVT